MENQVRLRWASHQGTVLSVFEALLSAETMVDVTLAADGQYLRAHKILLSACSPYFQELLSMDLNKNPIIFMKDVKYSELKALVHFIYRGEVNIAQEDLPSFLAVAQSLQIRGLASVDTPANNIRSDTLILPDFNSSHASSKQVGPGQSGMNINTMTSTYEHGPTQVIMNAYSVPVPLRNPGVSNHSQAPHSHNQPSIPIPDLDLQASSIIPPVIPPPAKRLRGRSRQYKQNRLDLSRVNIPSSTSKVQTHSVSASAQAFDPLSTQSISQMTASLDQEQGHSMDHGMEEEPEPIFQAGEMKIEIEEEVPTVVVGAYDEPGENEEGDNSMSQSHSSFAEHGESHDFEEPENSMVDLEDDDREITGGSGAGNGIETGGQAGGSGSQGEGFDLECAKCGRQFPPASCNRAPNSHRRDYLRHCRFLCKFISPQFECKYCQVRIRLRENLRRHERKCTRRGSR